MEAIRLKFAKYPWYPWLIFLSVTTGTFMVNVDSSILNVALPVLEDYFIVGPETLQWVVSSYLLVITGILPAVGKLSDIVGRKKMFIIGVFIFVLGSLLAAIAQSVTQLIIYRVFQGIGGAIMQGNVMSIIAHTFAKGNRGKALGMIGSVVAAGTIAGPSIGGFIIDQFGWRAIFWINLPIGLIGIIGAYLFLPKEERNYKKINFDYIGATSFFIAVVLLLLYIGNGQIWGWTSAISWVILGISLINWFIFYYIETNISSPLLDLSFFRSSTFSIGNLTGFSSYVLIMFPAILLPLHLSNVAHLPAYQIGFVMTFQAVAMMIAAPISGYLSDRVGSELPAMLGMGVVTLSLFLLGDTVERSSITAVITSLSLFGIGMGLFQSPNNVSILESVPVDQTGITGGIIATVRNFGRVSGVAFAILLLQLNQGIETVNHHYSGIGTVFYIGSGYSLLNFIILFSRMRIRRAQKKESF